jgi:hypothetical protein
MGFTIYYRSTRRLGPAQANAIRKATATLIAGRTWLSCEPVCFFHDQKDGRLLGGSKPNFQPHPDDVTAAARESLPDGTVHDMLEILCKLSSDFKVDWEFSHDHDPGPIGFIRGGVCEPPLREQVEAFGDLGGILREITGDFETQSGGSSSPPFGTSGPDSDDESDDDGGPSVLPFRPKGD